MFRPDSEIPPAQSKRPDRVKADTLLTPALLNQWQALLDKLEHELSEPYREKVPEGLEG
jgi:hypothetical protein